MGPRRGWRDSRVLAAVGMAVILALVGIQAPRLLAQPGNPQYTVLDYGPMDDQGSVLRHINGLREIAGGFRRPGSGKVAGAVVGGQQSQQEIRAGLGSGGELSIAYGINDRGDVAGSFSGDTGVRPFRSNRGNAVRELPLLPGDTGGIAYAINGGGEAVGYSSGASGQRAVWWDGSGAVRGLPGSTGATSRALGLNDRGDTVGTVGDEPRQATLWPGRGAGLTLPTLPTYTGAEAVSVNESGTAVGFVLGGAGAPGRTRAVLWGPADRSVKDLGALPGGSDSRARDVSPDDRVVGVAASGAGDRAFVWTAAAGMVDLNTLVAAGGLVLVDAVSINRNGEILAVGYEPGAASGNHVHAAHERPRRVMVLVPVR
jgi:probable HAF family extracellular repeat protein